MDYKKKYHKYKLKYLELLGNQIGSGNSFQINSSFNFFSNRIKEHSAKIIPRLTNWLDKIKTDLDPIKKFIEIMEEINKECNGASVSWFNLSKNLEEIKNLWGLRECIVSISFQTASRIVELNEGKTIKIGKNKNRIINVKNAVINILGSNSLLSDIDISIESVHSSTWISIIEDLWELTNWFNHSKWRVDLYGDFTMIGEYYIDTKYFDKEILKKLLELSIVSFFRHSKSIQFDLKLLDHLINWAILEQGLLIDKNAIITKSKLKIVEIKKESREKYYLELKQAENFQIEIKKFIENKTLNKIELNNLLGKVIIHLGEANLYREENYILPSTVIHIVKIEQAKNSNHGSCIPLLSKIAKCSLNSFIYILSGIEQLGYLQQNLAEGNVLCSLPASKYFGRLLRAINQSLNGIEILHNIISKDNELNKLLLIAENFEKEKKEKANLGNSNIFCEVPVDLYKLTLDLFKK
jgi:hypothetical protein